MRGRREWPRKTWRGEGRNLRGDVERWGGAGDFWRGDAEGGGERGEKFLVVSLSMERALLEKADAYARSKGMSRSQLVADALRAMTSGRRSGRRFGRRKSA